MKRRNLFGIHACPLSRGVPTPRRSCLARRPHISHRNLSCGRLGIRASPPSRCGPTPPPTCLDDPSGHQICLRSPPCSLMGGGQRNIDKAISFGNKMLIGDKKAVEVLSTIRSEFIKVKEEEANVARDLDRCEFFCKYSIYILPIILFIYYSIDQVRVLLPHMPCRDLVPYRTF